MTTVHQLDDYAKGRFAVSFWTNARRVIDRSTTAAQSVRDKTAPAVVLRKAMLVEAKRDCYAWEKPGDVRWLFNGTIAVTAQELSDLEGWLDTHVTGWRDIEDDYGPNAFTIEPLDQNPLWRGERLGHVLAEGQRAADEDL